MNDCALVDVGYTGPSWAFEKKVAGGTYTRVRLDRFLVCSAWASLFPQAIVRHLTAVTSDHLPIMMDLVVARTKGG